MVGGDKQASKVSAIQDNNIYEGTSEDSFFLSKNEIHKNKQKTLSVPASTVAAIHKSLRSARLHMIKCFLNSKRQIAPPNLPGHLCEADLTMAVLYEVCYYSKLLFYPKRSYSVWFYNVYWGQGLG